MENQHKKISGYRDLSQSEIDLMNECKELASKVGEMVNKLHDLETNDQRCVRISKTKLQEGFMWAIRAVAQPTTF